MDPPSHQPSENQKLRTSSSPDLFVRHSNRLSEDNPKENVVLFIDEINRGDIYEIFGEVFQLMERDSSGMSQGIGV